MASDNAEQCVHKLGFTSRDIKKLTVSTMFICVFVPGSGWGSFENSSSGVGLLKHSHWTPQSMGIGVAC